MASFDVRGLGYEVASQRRSGLHLLAGVMAVLLGPLPWHRQRSQSSAFAESPQESAEQPPGVILLRVAEVTSVQEGLLRRVVAALHDEGLQEDLGVVIGRGMLTNSVRVLLQKTDLDRNLSRDLDEGLPVSGRKRGEAYAQACIAALAKVAEVDSAGSGPMTEGELEQMADLYAEAREQLRLLFELFPEDAQKQMKEVARKVREYERKAVST